MNQDIAAYHDSRTADDKAICEKLYSLISQGLPKAESKVWHGHPVWFLNGNPLVGYSKLKGNVRLLFWSGQSFDEPNLHPEGTFKAAEIRLTNVDQIKPDDIVRYLEKAQTIQWDYKNIVKNRGTLHRLP